MIYCILFSVPLCAIICGICGYIWLQLLSQPDITVTTYYEFGVWSILISCIIELCCEQLYIVAQAFLFVKLQVIKKKYFVCILCRSAYRPTYFTGF